MLKIGTSTNPCYASIHAYKGAVATAKPHNRRLPRHGARHAVVQAINKRQQAQLDTLAPAGAHQLRGSFFFGGGTRLLVRERRREEHDDRGEEPEAERREEVAAEVALV